MRESTSGRDFIELNVALRADMTAFGKRVQERRPDIRFTVEQPRSIHYASSTLLDFLWDRSDDDLVVASVVLDLRNGNAVWSINITTGDGMPIAERSVPPDVAAAMLASPERARAEVRAFLGANFDALLGALPHVTSSYLVKPPKTTPD